MYEKKVESSAEISDAEPNFFTIKPSNFPQLPEHTITVKRADGLSPDFMHFVVI